jgi:hypothetical protein
MVKLTASAILDAVKLRVTVVARTVGHALGWVVLYVGGKWLGLWHGLSNEEILWILIFYIVLSLTYRFELLKVKLDLR